MSYRVQVLEPSSRCPIRATRRAQRRTVKLLRQVHSRRCAASAVKLHARAASRFEDLDADSSAPSRTTTSYVGLREDFHALGLEKLLQRLQRRHAAARVLLAVAAPIRSRRPLAVHDDRKAADERWRSGPRSSAGCRMLHTAAPGRWRLIEEMRGALVPLAVNALSTRSAGR